MNLTEVTDLTSIGTLFAFVLVCGGILRLDPNRKEVGPGKRFRTPYFNSKYVFPAMMVVGVAACFYFNREGVNLFFSMSDPATPQATAWEVFRHKIPLFFYLIGMVVLTGLCFRKSLSLIPVLGLATCGYLMTELGTTNWIRFGVWLVVGFVVYFFYGVKHSKLRMGTRG